MGKGESMGVVTTFINLVSVPLILLNLLGGIVSGVWLAIIGEWGAIGYGLLLSFFAIYLLSIVLMLGMIFGLPGIYFQDRGYNILSYFFILLSMLYTACLMTVWCSFIFHVFMKEATTGTFFPLLIWSYGVATGPWTFLASKDNQSGGNIYSTIAAFFAQIGYVIAMLLVAFFTITLLDVMLVIGLALLVGMLINFTTMITIERERKSYSMDIME